MFHDQKFNSLYPQINLMISMRFNSNYFKNDPNYKFMLQIAGYNKGGIIPNESNIPLNMNIPINIPINYNLNGVDPYYYHSLNMNMGMGNMYPNPNFNNNNVQNKKKQNKENLVKKDIDNKNTDDIIENATAYSKDYSGSRQIQKK